jgi:hypothetical protein
LFKNTVLRRTFWPKRKDVTGDWKKHHNEELHDLHSSPNIIRLMKARRMNWGGGGACGAYWETRGAYIIFVGKHKGKRALGRSRRRWGTLLK